MVDAMPKKADPLLPGLVQSNVRMPQVVIDELDVWVEDLNRAAGWAKFTRSDLIRNIVDEALERRRAAKEKAP